MSCSAGALILSGSNKSGSSAATNGALIDSQALGVSSTSDPSIGSGYSSASGIGSAIHSSDGGSTFFSSKSALAFS